VEVGETLLDVDVVDLIRVTPAYERAAWDLFMKRTDKEYSFTDCTSFALMRRLKITTAVSLDDDFRREGFDLLGRG
jgi:predicted nucleic acid-binding protein